VIAGLIGYSCSGNGEDVHGTDYYPAVRRRAILNVLSVPPNGHPPPRPVDPFSLRGIDPP